MGHLKGELGSLTQLGDLCSEIFTSLSYTCTHTHTQQAAWETPPSQVAGPEVHVTLHSLHSQGTLGRSCQQTS